MKSIVSTGLTPPQIGNLIALADEDVDRRLGGASASANRKKLMSMLITGKMIKGNDPLSYSIGMARVQFGDVGEGWEKWVNRIVASSVGRWDVVDPLAD